MEPIMVVVCHWPPGAWSWSRRPRRARPRNRVRLVLAQDSSRKTSRSAGHSFCRSRQRFLCSWRSARSCSLARSVFFIAVAQTPQRVVDRHYGAGDSQLLADLLQRRVGMPVHVLLESIELPGLKTTGLPDRALAWSQAPFVLALPLELIDPPFS